MPEQKKFDFSYDTVTPEKEYYSLSPDSFRAEIKHGITSMIESPKMTELVSRVASLEERMSKVEGAVIRAIGTLADIRETLENLIERLEGE